jgi:type IV pilus assembly protein PilB
MREWVRQANPLLLQDIYRTKSGWLGKTVSHEQWWKRMRGTPDGHLNDAQRRAARYRVLCELLSRSGWLDQQRIPDLLKKQLETGLPLTRVLSRECGTTEKAVAEAIAASLGYPFVDVTATLPDPRALSLISSKQAHAHRVLPLRLDNQTLTFATADPIDLEAEAILSAALNRYHLRWEVAEEAALLDVIANHYGKPLADRMVEGNEEEAADVRLIRIPEEYYTLAELRQMAHSLSASRVLDTLYADAIAQHASDIHIEPTETDVHVRYRVDGFLHLVTELPKSLQAPLVSRAKLLADMDISNSRKPQDGSCRLLINEKRIDLRLSSLPTLHGEKLVIRILDPSITVPTLKDLGFLPHDQERFERLLRLSQGMILVTGPTGSGKSTTLYACIEQLAQEKSNVVTVEDPIEREIAGVNQVPISQIGGVTFASALRSILRQDPNVIMVGEIRDRETADVSFRAALTGHLVLSTLHTLDAPSAVVRCVDLGLEPYLVASALSGVLAQRLLRRKCPYCTQPIGNGQFESPGCHQCNYTGFKGRVGVYELLVVDDNFRSLLAQGASMAQLREAARAAGMRTLAEDAHDKIAQGWLVEEEVAEVIIPETPATPPSAVSIPIPLPKTEDLPPPPVVTNPSPAPPAPATSQKSFKKERILVAEDDYGTREIIRRVLEKNLYEVITAENGEIALQKIFDEMPDIILTDVVMPELEGYDLCKRIKSHPQTKHIPVIMLTGQDELESELRGLEVGADDYILKPVEPKRLIARLTVILRRLGKIA